MYTISHPNLMTEVEEELQVNASNSNNKVHALMVKTVNTHMMLKVVIKLKNLMLKTKTLLKSLKTLLKKL